MPSGYTYKIVEGEQSFEEFAYGAVRAMGAFIHMRDDSLDTPLYLPEDGWVKVGSPDKVEKHRADLRDYERQLRDELAKTPEEIEAEFESDKKKQMVEYKERYAKVLPINERVTRMTAEITDWQPPTSEHEGFKKFMLQQITETTDWDASLPKEPTFSDSATEYHEEEVRFLEKRVESCKELLQKEIDSPDVQENRVDWIKELVASITPPPETFAEGEL